MEVKRPACDTKLVSLLFWDFEGSSIIAINPRSILNRNNNTF